VRFYKEPLEWLPFSATDLLKPEPNSILQPLRALLQQRKFYAQLAQHGGGGLGRTTRTVMPFRPRL
jgi:hypothetical protein